MGSKLWAVDMILIGLMRPMINAYVFGQFKKASKLLFSLNCFLIGYGEGVESMPEPKNLPVDVRSRSYPESDYEKYYEKYSGVVLVKMGKYIRWVLDHLPNQIEQPTESELSETLEIPT